MNFGIMTPAAAAGELGDRLNQARLNADMTQSDLAKQAGVSRKLVIQAEKGKVQLEVFVALLLALKLGHHLEAFLPNQILSPIQLAKLQAKQRQRASGLRKAQPDKPEETGQW